MSIAFILILLLIGLLPFLIISSFPELTILFLILFVYLVIFFYRLVLSEKSMFNLTVFIYYVVFLYIAPVFQIYYDTFPNRQRLNVEYACANILLSLLFLIIYSLIHRKLKLGTSLNRFIGSSVYDFEKTTPLFIVFTVASLFIILVFAKSLVHEVMLGGEYQEIGQVESTMQYLLIKRFLYFIPFVPFLILFSKLKKKGNTFWFLFAVIITLAVALLFKNPFNEKRGLLGSIYLSWLFYYILLKRSFKISTTFIKMSFVLIIIMFLFLYPSVKVLTHLNYSITSMINNFQEFVNSFSGYLTDFKYNITSLDFDSWINAHSTLGYINKYGHTWGKQTLTSLLFFVPRSVYKSKGEGTGGIIGSYVIAEYGSWQRQMSNPLYSEAFLDLSLPGLFLYAFFLDVIGKISAACWKTNNNYLILFSLFLVFYNFYLFRGDFISSLAYLVGYTVATVLTPLLLSRSVKLFNVFSSRL